ncbi:MAG: hypothetical protein M0T74_04795 [Desulfitobacterium hafniense]|nr:hypothetical protein [Desulfitobacterium hafniense]
MQFDVITLVWQLINFAILLAIPAGLIAFIVFLYRKLNRFDRNVQELSRDVAEIKGKLNK